MKGKLLLLAPVYPPMPRLLKLARYLPAFGWDILILVPRSRSTCGDVRFVGEGASVLPFETTYALPSAVDVVRRLWGRRGHAGTSQLSVTQVTKVHRGARALLRQLLLWLSLPDDLVGWIPFAAVAARRLAERKDIHALLATGPPFSCVLAGLAAKRLTKLPLIADFRDAWTLDPADPFGCLSGPLRAPSSGARRTVLEALERAVVRHADRLLFTSDRTHDAYLQAFPDIQRRAAILYNGAEEADFGAPADATKTTDFCFTHVGTLHEYQLWQVELFLRAFAIARQSHTAIGNARVRLYGHMTEPVRQRLVAVAMEEGIAAQIEIGPPVHHDRGVALMKSEGVVLMFAGRSLFTRLSKITDALVVGRPMLALALADSETARHVRAGGGAVYSGDDRVPLADLLDQIARHPLARARLASGFPFPYPHPLNWRSMARAVAVELDELTGRPQEAKELVEFAGEGGTASGPDTT